MTPTTITVVVVESHQHVLEHIHDVLRKKKLFDKTWSMVHFDAHPDLACSKSVPAVAFFNPRHYFLNSNNDEEGDGCKSLGTEEDSMNLYELLDLTPSGIAEWILPLVLAAKLKVIEWVKPRFSSQILEGNYQFAVGVECHSRDEDKFDDSKDENITSYLDLPASAQVKVDFKHPYYLDDLSVVPSAQLVLKQNIELQVSELRSLPLLGKQGEKNVSSDIWGNVGCAVRNRNLWALDICLDYFACQNPYILDLESKNPLATRAFLNLMEGSKFNTNTTRNIDNNQLITSLEYQTEIIRFYESLEKVILDNIHQNNEEQPKRNDFPVTSSTSEVSFEEISKHFETAEKAERLIRQLIIEINNEKGNRAQLSSMIIEAIPNWSMPHNGSSAVTEEINESLRLVESHIQQHVRQNDQPFLITIARSTLDGFCPPQVVETLQCRVLDMLQRQICGENRQCYKTENSLLHEDCGRLLVVRDYGEWEGSVIPHQTVSV